MRLFLITKGDWIVYLVAEDMACALTHWRVARASPTGPPPDPGYPDGIRQLAEELVPGKNPEAELLLPHSSELAEKEKEKTHE